MTHSHKPSPQEADIGRMQVPIHPGIYLKQIPGPSLGYRTTTTKILFYTCTHTDTEGKRGGKGKGRRRGGSRGRGGGGEFEVFGLGGTYLFLSSGYGIQGLINARQMHFH